MKILIFILACISSLTIFGQTSENDFDGKTWEAPYKLSFPKEWDIERFLIPISFAPEIKYSGVEDIRFTPGWGNPKSDEYWSYAFLWFLDGSIETNEKIVEKNLRAYYTGLVGSNIGPRNISAEKLLTVKPDIKIADTYKGDIRTYQGTIYMLDYMEQKPIILNCIVHIKKCKGQNKTFIFHEISPKPYNDFIWQSLNQLWTDFVCDKGANSK